MVLNYHVFWWKDTKLSFFSNQGIKPSNKSILSTLAVSSFVVVPIHFPLYDFLAFKILANSYMRLKDHKFFSQVKDIVQSRVSLSSVEISKLMIVNQNSLSWGIKSGIPTLQTNGELKGVEKIRSQIGNNATPKHPFDRDIMGIFRKNWLFLKKKFGSLGGHSKKKK